jgi:hypothetical protein
LREHQVLVVVAMIGFASLGFDTWAAWHQFAQQQHQFHDAASFWSVDFLAFWGNGVSQNWQSEALFGIGLVLILQSSRLREREPDGSDGPREGPSPTRDDQSRPHGPEPDPLAIRGRSSE